MRIDLTGRIALVCGGGAGGIGSAVTKALAQAGARLAVVDQTEELNKATRDEMQAIGLDCETFAFDLTSPAQSAATVGAVLARMGRIDIVVNVAGGSRRHQWRPLETTPDDDLRDVFALNFDYVFRVCRDFAKHVVERGGPGTIVNFASTSGIASAPFHGLYGAAKAGIVVLSQTMAIEWARRGIRVNVVAPGSVRTPRLEAYENKTGNRFSIVDGQRHVEREEIANGVLFLASDLSSGLTGQTLVIDGGLSCGNPAGTVSQFAQNLENPAEWQP